MGNRKTFRNTGRAISRTARYSHRKLRGETMSVHFAGNKARSGQMPKVSCKVHGSMVMPEPGFTRPGYSFYGWSTTNTRGNLLTGTLSPKKVGKIGPHALHKWRQAGGEGTREAVPIEDPPAKGITRGFHIAGNANVGVAQTGIPVEVGRTYTLSCYLKGKGGLNLQAGNNRANVFASSGAVASTEWKRVQMTFLATEDLLQKGKITVLPAVLYRGSDFTICGLKLEAGADLSAYCSDDNGERCFTPGETARGLVPGKSGRLTLTAVWDLATYTVSFDGNGATAGLMSRQPIPVGRTYLLPTNQFEKPGAVFAGWNQKPDGSGKAFRVGRQVKNIAGGKDTTLYAQWDPCVWLLRYHANGGAGEMPKEAVKMGREHAVSACGFTNGSNVFAGWNTKPDGTGTSYLEGDPVKDLKEGKVTVRKLFRVDAPKTEKALLHCQGTCVAKNPKDGKTYAVACFIRNTSKYLMGDMSDYESSIVLYDVEKGAVVRHVEGLYIEHANGVCYNPETEHFYVARLGQAGLPGGILELDWDLREVADHPCGSASGVMNVAWKKPYYYSQMSLKDGGQQLVVFDEDFNVKQKGTELFGYDGFVGQGFETDGTFFYGIAVDFSDKKWPERQRLTVYASDGTYLGSEWISGLPDEIEDITYLDGKMYLSTNRHTYAEFYAADPSEVDLYAQWKETADE